MYIMDSNYTVWITYIEYFSSLARIECVFFFLFYIFISCFLCYLRFYKATHRTLSYAHLEPTYRPFTLFFFCSVVTSCNWRFLLNGYRHIFISSFDLSLSLALRWDFYCVCIVSLHMSSVTPKLNRIIHGTWKMCISLQLCGENLYYLFSIRWAKSLFELDSEDTPQRMRKRERKCLNCGANTSSMLFYISHWWTSIWWYLFHSYSYDNSSQFDFIGNNSIFA